MGAHSATGNALAAVNDFLLDMEFDNFDIASSRNAHDMERLALVCDNVSWDKSAESDDDIDL